MQYSNYRENDFINLINKLGVNHLDILVTGVTGAGKSTTLNALLGQACAKVGEGVEPETMRITDYKLNERIVLWDSPGLGDNNQIDKEHKKKIIELLHRNYGKQHFRWIDMVFVIIEGSKRDLGTTNNLIDLIVSNFPSEKIFVAINQADIAMSGRHWDTEKNCPDAELSTWLNEFSNSIQRRIRESTGLDFPKPLYYSAKCNYNLNIFMDFIIEHIPQQLSTLR